MIYAYRVTSGQENIVLDMLTNKGEKVKESVGAIVYFPEVKGYIFIETTDLSTAKSLSQGIRHIKGMLAKPVELEEMTKLIEEGIQSVKLGKGDIIEFTSGPFKGERGKITRIDESKDTITVELIDVAVSVPVTAKISTVKIIQKAEEEE
jgi:transcriptional antiterminator NusG